MFIGIVNFLLMHETVFPICRYIKTAAAGNTTETTKMWCQLYFVMNRCRPYSLF